MALNRVRSMQVPALFAAVVLVGANSFVLSPMLSEVATGLDTAPYRIAWAISAFGGATALSALLLAPLIDRVSAATALGAAALLLACAQLMCATSQTWFWLCLWQALAGVAVGVLLPGTYATAAATAPPGRESARLGTVLTGWALSLVLAVPAAGFIAGHLDWRLVYGVLAALSGVTALGLVLALRRVRIGTPSGSSTLRALRLPGIGFLLALMFGFMTAFYGTFAYYGEGIRRAFTLSSDGTGLFVLAYGLGFGLAGLALGAISPTITRRYLVAVFSAITAVYAGWRLALSAPALAFAMAIVWGFLNQLGLNALVVSLSRRAGAARGAVMGLNSAVTYSAVFAGPAIMGYAFTGWGFAAVTMVAGGAVALCTLAVLAGSRAFSTAAQ